MGIPHLITTLEPYAVLCPLTGQDVVIDGPALAYHVLNICRGNNVPYPAPDVIGRAAIRWLNELTSRSVSIKAIYFDGYLPPSKSSVRMERMARNTTQLKQFFSSNPRGCPTQYVSKAHASLLNLFELRHPNTRALVAPTFLVPAVTDALRQHHVYRFLVHLVPAEADTRCAQHLAEHGGVVLTSDSDLLVHGLGRGMVAFFRDVHISADDELVSATFIPTQICLRLGLNDTDMCRLAYERKRSPHASLPQIVQACLVPLEEPSYDEFRQQYLCHEVADLPASPDGHELCFEHLDPRLSELALQLGQPQPRENSASTELKIFLPVLLDNPQHGSAWEPSTCVRVLAYTMARQMIPGPNSVVFEYRRVQNMDQKGRQLNLFHKASSEALVVDIVSLVHQLRTRTNGTHDSLWLFLYIILDIKDRQKLDKDSFVLRMLQSPASTAPMKRSISWDLVHLLAHMQAMWYSLRMLRQVLSMLPPQSVDKLSTEARRLRTLFEELPRADRCPDFDDLSAWFHTQDHRKNMEMLSNFVTLTNKMTQKTKKRKDEDRNGGSKLLSESHAKSKAASTTNKFDLLAMD